MAIPNPYAETVVPRAAVRFPLRLPAPKGFDPDRLETWPDVVGRLEFFEGALWYMPPCGDEQQETAADAVGVLVSWRRAHRDFVIGTNEAGMKLGGSVRGADAAVWRKADVGQLTGGLRRVAPVLAVELAGVDDTVELLRQKADWYLSQGTQVVWLLVPDECRAIVVTSSGETSFTDHQPLPEHPALPGLRPNVAELFEQLRER